MSIRNGYADSRRIIEFRTPQVLSINQITRIYINSAYKTNIDCLFGAFAKHNHGFEIIKGKALHNNGIEKQILMRSAAGHLRSGCSPKSWTGDVKRVTLHEMYCATNLGSDRGRCSTSQQQNWAPTDLQRGESLQSSQYLYTIQTVTKKKLYNQKIVFLKTFSG